MGTTVMRLTLSKKLMLLIISLFAIQSICLYYFVEDIVEDILLDESRKQAQVFLDGLEREIVSSSNHNSQAFLQNTIDKAVARFQENNFSIYRLYIFNEKGKIFADSLTMNKKYKTIGSYINPVFREGKKVISNKIECKIHNNKNTARDRIIFITDVIIPVYKNGKILYAIEVEINLNNTLSNIAVLSIKYEEELCKLILISCILFMLLLWFLLKKSVLTPIQRIDKIAKNISAGKLQTRIHLKGSDEIVHLGRSINTMAVSIESLLEEQELAYIQALQSLSKALEAKDPYTAGHSVRVAKFSAKLGECIGLSGGELALLNEGALMHDLGKIAIPDHILNKPDKLSDEEYNIMRSHPIKTAEIMKPLRRYAKHREIAAWHHEQWNGKGYPDGLKGDEIPLLARIVSIADSWDAMTGDRVYRKGMSEEKALSIMTAERDSGQWDPNLLILFIKIMRNIV